MSSTAVHSMQESPKPKPKTAGQVFHPEVDYDDRIDHMLRAEDLPLRVPSDKYERNIRAIRLLHQLEDENRLATESEQKLLADYSGWGGLSDRFDENHSDYEELKSILSPEEYTAARESTLTAFYTPPVVIEAMYKALENMGFSRGNILEPSCGVGNFIGLLPESMSDSKVYGVELDILSGRMAQQLYQKQNITVGGFEETLFPDSFFDVAIGNIPFGQFKVVDKNIHAEITEVESANLEEDTDFIPADPNVKNFSYTLVDGKVYYRQNSIMNRVETTVTGENRIKGMIAISA